MKNDLYIFLDESGTNERNKVSIVGALAIPNDIYNSEEFNKITGKLRSKELKIHFIRCQTIKHIHFMLVIWII